MIITILIADLYMYISVSDTAINGGDHCTGKINGARTLTNNRTGLRLVNKNCPNQDGGKLGPLTTTFFDDLWFLSWQN